MTPTKPLRVHTVSLCDHIKGNWYVWHCVAHMPDGRIIDGTVQADSAGDGADLETFEPDEN